MAFIRLKDLQETVADITPKALSKEFQDLEKSPFLTRTVNGTKQDG